MQIPPGNCSQRSIVPSQAPYGVTPRTIYKQLVEDKPAKYCKDPKISPSSLKPATRYSPGPRVALFFCMKIDQSRIQ
jgi:hypothetical protein